MLEEQTRQGEERQGEARRMEMRRELRTERGPLFDIVSEEIARADGGELRESLQQSLRLRAFPHARRAD